MDAERKMQGPLVVRKMDFPFVESEIPRYWFNNHMLGTHISNALHLIFPKGEQFFVRSVRYYEDRIENDVLKEQIKGFYGQEGAHSREHERFFEVLEGHGIKTNRFLKLYQFLAYTLLEPLGPRILRLAVTAALEHFTAMYATSALSKDRLDGAHPVLRDLLRWHSAEEIEHKAVAFDVLQTINKSYLLRMLGLVIAMIVLSGFWTIGTFILVAQEEKGFRRAASQFVQGVLTRQIWTGEMARAFFDYWRRDFHPDDIDNRELAREYLKKIQRLAA
jgi:predicted metal-dependent hydrolase